jgi:hypothetical protein
MGDLRKTERATPKHTVASEKKKNLSYTEQIFSKYSMKQSNKTTLAQFSCRKGVKA